jgi:hypothetical protein
MRSWAAGWVTGFVMGVTLGAGAWATTTTRAERAAPGGVIQAKRGGKLMDGWTLILAEPDGTGRVCEQPVNYEQYHTVTCVGSRAMEGDWRKVRWDDVERDERRLREEQREGGEGDSRD